METPTLSTNKLIDHLVLVGPGRDVLIEPLSLPSRRTRVVQEPSTGQHRSWQGTSSSILAYFSSCDQKDSELPADVVYFCQPEGCGVEVTQPKTHVFMLTDTATNIRTNGVCMTIPHLFDPSHSSLEVSGDKCSLTKPDSICIQEWGILSVCILSRHPFFNFFAKCLKTLAHFMEHFSSNELSWNALIRAQSGSTHSRYRFDLEAEKRHAGKEKVNGEHKILTEVQDWINRLLLLPAPEIGGCGLEVELEVDPAILLCYPSKNRLPFFDLPLHRIFQKLGVHLVIEIFKLVLSEQKVILTSSDVAFSSECVFSIVTLLYPLQYLYPVIPLLPSSMPTAENLLMVPTPFLIGVCDTFMKKVQGFQMAETWVVNLDTKEIKEPQVQDQPLLEFPYSILQLQANIRKAMDKIQDFTVLTADSNLQLIAQTIPLDSHAPTIPTAGPSLGEDHPDRYMLDEVDVIIRIAFVQFLFDPEILGIIEQHLCIYRLFPRPVVALRNSAFLTSYRNTVSTSDTCFIKELIKTQCVEYFFQYSLNPSNFAFEEIKRGVSEPERLSDKHHYYGHRNVASTEQVSLFSQTPDSFLYQEMLTFKASATRSKEVSFDSDWDVTSGGGDHYDGGSERSLSSDPFYSDNEESFSSLLAKKGSNSSNSFSKDFSPSQPSEYHTPSHFSKSLEDKDTPLIKRSNKMPQFHPLPHIVAKVKVLQRRANSLEDLSSPIYQSDEGKMYLTPGNEDSSSDVVEADYHHQKLTGDLLKLDRKLVQFSTPSGVSSSSLEDLTAVPSMFKRGVSLLRGEKTEKIISPLLRTSTVSNASTSNSHGLELQIQDLVSKIVDGQGLPWPKPAYLKRLASQEKTRVLVLRLLEEKLGVREPGETVMATSDQIIAVGISKATFKGIMELLKYLIVCIEEEIQKDLEASIFSMFLIFRIAFSVYLPPKKPRNTISMSLLNALNINSFVTPGGPEAHTPVKSTPEVTKQHPEVTKLQKPLTNLREKELVSELPQIAISDTDEETEELHILRTKNRGRRSSSPLLLTRTSVSRISSRRNTQSLDLSDVVGEDRSELVMMPVLPEDHKPSSVSNLTLSSKELEKFHSKVSSPHSGAAVSNGPEISSIDRVTVASSPSEEGTKSFVELGGEEKCNRDSSVSVGDKLSQDGGVQSDDKDMNKSKKRHSLVRSVSVHSEDHLSQDSLDSTDKSNMPPSGQVMCEQGDTDQSSSTAQEASPLHSASSSTQLLLIPTETFATPTKTTPLSSFSDISLSSVLAPSASPFPKRPTSGSTSPLEGSVPPSPQPPDKKPHPFKQPILLSDLINSPRFYHPQEGQDLTGCTFLYKELMKGLGHSRDFMLSKHFWNQLFISTVTVDRSSLGWNERTAALFSRYNSLSESHRQTFGFEEDNLLSIILHNLLVYMLVVGLTPQDTTGIVHRFSARTRLAIVEERMMQQTLKHIEQCIEEDTSHDLDVNMLGLMALYSEVHPTVSYIVHYGIDMLAPVYKLQITDEVLILRRFPDNKICSRLWNDCISIVRCSKTRSTVSVFYKDVQGEYYHHFHTKQYLKVYESLQVLVSPGRVECESSRSLSPIT